MDSFASLENGCVEYEYVNNPGAEVNLNPKEQRKKANNESFCYCSKTKHAIFGDLIISVFSTTDMGNTCRPCRKVCLGRKCEGVNERSSLDPRYYFQQPREGP